MSAFTREEEMILADKYGVQHGEENGLTKELVQGNITYNNLENELTLLDLPRANDWSSPSFLNLESIPIKVKYFVTTKVFFDFWLAVNTQLKHSYIRKARYINAYMEIHRVLKDDGHFIQICQSVEHIEELRSYLRECGVSLPGPATLVSPKYMLSIFSISDLFIM